MQDPHVSSINVDVRQHSTPQAPKNRVVSFLESTTGTALITIFLGGVLGQFISCDVQNRLRERDFNETWLKSRGEQALAARKEFDQARRVTFEEIITTAGQMTNATEEFLYITSPAFSTERLEGEARKNLMAEREKLHTGYRAADARWGPARTRYDFLIGYFSENDPAVIAAWKAAKKAVDDYRKCAADTYNKWYLAGQGGDPFQYDDSLCDEDQDRVAGAIQDLGGKFVTKADYAWQGWNDPALLKKALRIER
jgi:hypothetical protein